MSSREQAVLAEILTRLDGEAKGPIPRPEGLTCSRYRLREVAPTQHPHISIYPMDATTERKGYLSETGLITRIVIFAKGSADTPIDEDLDPLWLWVHQQLFADESLGGLAIRIDQLQKVWGANLAQRPFGDLDIHYNVIFRHQSANPSLA